MKQKIRIPRKIKKEAKKAYFTGNKKGMKHGRLECFDGGSCQGGTFVISPPLN